MYITLSAIKFYFIIKSLFSIRFFKTLAPRHHALAIDYSDIVMAMVSSSFDMLNVIYHSHTLIQLRRTRLPPFSMLMPLGFVRRNFIGHHGWNGSESTNEPRSFCHHLHLRMMSCLSVLMLTTSFT